MAFIVHASVKHHAPMQRLSFAVNCYNEAACVYHSLRSVRAHADEIVVLDNCSEDDTIKQIRRFIAEHDDAPPVRLLTTDRVLDIATARNRVLAACQHDFVVKWDGDFVANDSIGEVLDCVRQTADRFDVHFWTAPNLFYKAQYQSVEVPFTGRFGDQFVHRRGAVEYYASDRYPDAIRFRPGARFNYRFRCVEQPHPFVHVYCAKGVEYMVYRKHWSTYHRACGGGGVDLCLANFWAWLEREQGKTRAAMVQACEAHLRSHADQLYTPVGFPLNTYLLAIADELEQKEEEEA